MDSALAAKGAHVLNSLADAFFALHKPGAPFILPNAWDAASSLVFERDGFAAVGTSSAAMSWSLGYADGEKVDTDELFAAIARMVRVTSVPVTADIEAGFGTTAEAAVRSVERSIAAGAVGANLEDFDPALDDLIPLEAHAERIRAVKARAAALGVRFFVNARTDVLLQEIGPAASRVDRAIERLRAYAAAGADGIFAPGATDAETIGKIAAAVDSPLNVLAAVRTPTVAELGKLGVARVSVGAAPMRRVLSVLRDIGRELRERGTFGFAHEPGLPYAELNGLFSANHSSKGKTPAAP
jgi:2-methylisocitrate lyase-like PEP mutase family enzyme